MKQPFIAIWCRQSAVGALALSFNLTLMRAQEVSPSNTPIPAAVAKTLDALVAEALEKSPELKFYEAEISAAKAGRKTAGQLGNPEVSGGVGQKRVSSLGLSDEGIAWSVSVVQPLEWPGRIGLRKAIANRDIELAQLGYGRFKIALAGRVRTLAYGLFAAQEKAAASSEVAERFKALREVLVQRDPAGLTPLLETRVIEATELNAQRKASEAMLATQAALLELNLLRGVAPETRLMVAQTQLSFRSPEERMSLLSLAQTNNFELRMRAVELAQQGFRVKLAQNERYSSLSIGPEYSEEKVGDDREQIIGVSVSMSLPLWDRNTGNIETAKARQMQAEVSLNVTERDIQRQVLSAALTYETKLREMAKWRPDSVQHFKEAAELADRHYRLGAVPISTYVELQQQYLDAVDGLLETKRETLEAASQLELLTGLSVPLAKTGVSEEAK
ncbi:MAG: TolC family protein [Verrucomicrobiota bacterium]